ncbi:25087_t:CDS:1, partial [Cetraspora pellucida]
MSKEEKLIDKLQYDFFYYGIDNNKTIITTVLEYINNNQDILKDKDIINEFIQIYKNIFISNKKLNESKNFNLELINDHESDNEYVI